MRFDLCYLHEIVLVFSMQNGVEATYIIFISGKGMIILNPVFL
jgi:hypothetical protein